MSRTARAVAVVAAVCVLAQLRQLGLVSRVHTAQVADAPLPAPPDHGWVALEDAASGRTYFYHAATGRSEWTRPAEMGTSTLAAPGGGGQDALDGRGGGDAVDHGWAEVEDGRGRSV